MPPPRTRSGVALIMVVGTLGVLSALGSSFCILGRIERRAALQRVHGTKALLLARSGVEDALARLDLGQDPAYGGEDLDRDGMLDLGIERDHEVYRRWWLDVSTCPVRQSLRPSFFVRDGTGTGALPTLRPVGRRLRGRSGQLSGDAHPLGNTWALKLVPEEGIYVNGGDLSSAGEHVGTYDTVLKRVLANLTEGILIGGLNRSDGEALVTARPAGGWTSMNQIRSAMGWTSGFLKAKGDALEPYLAFRAWTDRKVIRPNLALVDPTAFPPTPTFQNKQAMSWASLRTGHCDAPPVLWGGSCRKPNPSTRSYAPDFERDSQGAVLGRAPISLDWARSRPVVLKALLRDLRGLCVLRHGSFPMMPIALDSADVDAVVAAFGALGPATTYAAYPGWDGTWRIDSWEEFNRFVDEKVAFPPSLMLGVPVERIKRDLLKAHFNPNSNLSSIQPNAAMFRWIDKSDVTVYSTEFTFDPPAGFALSAQGVVTGDGGQLLAQRVISARVDARRFRLTAQSEFCAGDGAQGVLGIAGDEGPARLPGASGFVSTSGGLAGETTFGTKALGNHGQALQSYPEPQWPGGGCPVPAAYDGNLQLATLEDRPEAGQAFLASWTSGLDADFALGNPRLVLDYPANIHRPMGGALSLFGTTAPPASVPWISPAGGAARTYPELRGRVNALHPDGFHCDPRRVPCYLASGNLPPFTPTVSFWVKGGPCFDEALGNRTHTLLDAMRRVQTGMSGFPPSPVYSDQPFYIVHAFDDLSAGAVPNLPCSWSTLGETYPSNLDDGEFGKSIADALGPHVWRHVTCQWNLRAAGAGQLVELTVDGKPGAFTTYPGSDLSLPSASVGDLAGDAWLQISDGVAGTIYQGIQPHRIFFGAHREGGGLLRGRGDGSGTQFSDHLLDEYALYDLGPDLSAGRSLAQALHASGRYYKEDDGRWTSGEIRLPPGSRVTRMDWTLIRPAWDPSQADHPNRVFYGTGSDPASGDSADARIEVLSSGEAAWSSARPGTLLVPLPDGRLRLAATIRPRLADNVDGLGSPTQVDLPLVDSPVLDDLTVTWIPPGMGLTSWEPTPD